MPPRLLTAPSVGAKPQVKLLGKARKQAAAAQQAEPPEQRIATALGRRLEEAEAKLAASLPKAENLMEQLKAAHAPHHGGAGRGPTGGGLGRGTTASGR